MNTCTHTCIHALRNALGVISSSHFWPGSKQHRFTKANTVIPKCSSMAKIARTIERHTIDGNVSVDNRFIIELEHPQGCQFMNTHSIPISNTLNCNTDVQVGDSGQTFYETLYHTRNTRKEDNEPIYLVAKQVTRRLLWAQDAERECEVSGEEVEERVNDWVEG